MPYTSGKIEMSSYIMAFNKRKNNKKNCVSPNSSLLNNFRKLLMLKGFLFFVTMRTSRRKAIRSDLNVTGYEYLIFHNRILEDQFISNVLRRLNSRSQ